MAKEELPATIRGLYMDDFKRRIDFVLAYALPPPELDPMRTSTGTPVKSADPPAASSGGPDCAKTDAQAIELTPLTGGAGEPSATSPKSDPPGFFSKVFCCHKETNVQSGADALTKHINRRRFFEANLRRVGIQLEYSDSQVCSDDRHYSYVYCTTYILHSVHTMYLL